MPIDSGGNGMKNGLSMAALGASSLLLITSVALANERSSGDRMIRDTQVSYIAKHPDGTVEKVVVRYEAYLGHRVWQTGSSSKPYTGKIQDDRKCNLNLDARVYRRAYVLSYAGVQLPVESYQAIYKATSTMGRGADNFFEALTRHVTCGDVNNFADRIAGAESQLISQFDQLVAEDDDKARSTLKAMLMATELTGTED